MAVLTDSSAVPGLTQGRYGNAGNLELVVPLPDAGLRVHWYNSDARDGAAPQPIPPRRWSEGLRFGSAERHRAAAVAQLRLGPDHIAVTAITDAGAVSYFWTPADGFSQSQELLAGARACTALVEVAGAVRALAVDANGDLVELAADPGDYPQLSFTTAPAAPVAADSVSLDADPGTGRVRAVAVTAHDVRVLERSGHGWIEAGRIAGRWPMMHLFGDVAVGLDLDGGVAAIRLGPTGPGRTRELWRDARWTAMAAAATTLDGGRLDIVLSGSVGSGGALELWHGVAGATGSLVDPQPIVAAPRR